MSDPFVLGWEEWASLPDLGLPAIKVKVDTGARTSALHATGMRVEGPADARTLSFLVHPVRRRAEPAIACRAPLVGERVVTSSNGESERRYVIATRIRFGERSWPIEITLTNRESMSYRMLLGRNALAAGMLVDPLRGLLQPRLSYRVYRGGAAGETTRAPAAARLQPLAIAVLTRRPDSASNRLLAERAAARGHRVEFIDRRTISLFIEAGHSAILSTAAPLPRFHAVLARSSGRMQAASLAVLRQLELLGAVSLNPADALSLLAEPIRRAQELARAGLAAPALAVSFTGAGRKGGDDRMVAAGGELSLPAQAGRKHLRFLVIAGAARAVMLRSDDALADDETAQAWLADEVSRYAEAGHAAKAAAQAFRLGVAAVDVDLSSATPLVTDISPAPTLALFERVAHIDAAGALIEAIEVAVAADVPLRSRASPSGGR